MFSLFVVSCADCHAKIKIKNEKLLGKRLRCPKCGQAILVEHEADSPNAADDDEWDEDPPTTTSPNRMVSQKTTTKRRTSRTVTKTISLTAGTKMTTRTKK